MKVTYNNVEYTGIKALLIAIPSLVFIGVIFLAIGAVLSSPLWILLVIAEAML
jgi:hypothetical protein